MKLEERIIVAKNDLSKRNDIIREYMSFIRSCAGKTLGRLITDADDACSVAMLAFDEAIRNYDESKGKFLSFAQLLIRRRVTDYLRKEYSVSKIIPFSSLVYEDDEGETVFEIEDKNAGYSDVAMEISCVKEELKEYGISLFELPSAAPKFLKTKRGCHEVIRWMMQKPERIAAMKSRNTLPVKQILTSMKVNEKLIERHRKYIIAAVVILSGDYEVISEYFSFFKRGEG